MEVTKTVLLYLIPSLYLFSGISSDKAKLSNSFMKQVVNCDLAVKDDLHKKSLQMIW